jgi:transcriptional regulator with GAF, ATPase, and Fis domain
VFPVGLLCAVRAQRQTLIVPINCGASSAELLESELFGHEADSLAGSTSPRQGRFELAEGGVLFLDEVGDMPIAVQVKLLRVLQERCYQKVGGIDMKQYLTDIEISLVEQALLRSNNVVARAATMLNMRGTTLVEKCASTISNAPTCLLLGRSSLTGVLSSSIGLNIESELNLSP